MKNVSACSVMCCRGIWAVSFLHDIQEKRTANLGHRATSAAVFLLVQKKGNLFFCFFLTKGMCSNQSAHRAPRGLRLKEVLETQ